MTSLKSSPKKYAQIAGLLYLIIAICGGFSIGYMPTVIIDPENAATTALNIANNQGLFHMGIAGDIVVILLELIITVMLYRLLKPVSKTWSAVAAVARFFMTFIMGLNLLNYFIPLHLLSGAEYLNVFNPEQQEALALFFLNIHQDTIYLWDLFFGFHLIIVGYLVCKSGYFPKLLGTLMSIGSVGYILESLTSLTSVKEGPIATIILVLLAIVVIGEFSFAFWLLFKGIRTEKWEQKIS